MLNDFNNMGKGISLIVLIITIVVMIILASTVILSMDNNGTSLLNTATETAFKYDVQMMIDRYVAIYDDLVYNYQGDVNLITDLDFKNKEIIPEKYEDTFKVTKDGIVYLGVNDEEKSIVKEMGIFVCNDN